ncbi:rab-protein geranylgeranyltransferase [Cystobasidium minutum MCA 4210]|uniref:rab-protein geranylgeranyltransferase n=1 Tax=Cystobasidium minutum MCA 4210 TaxID=1397322 RepID=UPI0034CFFF24|eukprot:jgi/Rhomi1/171395/fgenesh1_kg.4_\
MHGVKRPRPGQKDPEDVARAKAAKERARIVDYTILREQLAHYRANKEYTNDALTITSRVLVINPEYPTGWAFRRRILQRELFQDKSQDQIQTLLEADLALTAKCLLKNPKEYAVWEHRKWVLKSMPDPGWEYELKMVQGLLERDARNYHGWDYRRYIVASLRSSTPPPNTKHKRPNTTLKSELAYTTNKISASFSNYSAWHYRSKLMEKILSEVESSEEREKMLDQEFDLVKQALYTDPDDQSAWIYHRWLTRGADVSIIKREVGVIQELLELEPESKWCLDSLVYYQKLLMSHMQDEQERSTLRNACVEHLKKLERVDGLRINRYKRLANEL